MKLHMLLLIGCAVGIVGCAEKEQAASEQESTMEPAAPAVTEAPPAEDATAVAEAPAADPDTTYAEIEAWRNEELLDHMHAHAEQLDDLNYALADGNLERAMTSAYWLSRHDTVSGMPESLQPLVDRMRDGARAVEAAETVEAAKSAAEQIGAACQDCHTATGAAIP